MRYLELDEVLRIHERAIQRYGGLPELRDLGLLESALAVPKQTMFGDDLYPDVATKAAILLFTLIKNHPFVDGNKRTGFLCLTRFLQVNDRALDATNDELYQFTLDVATSILDKEQVTAWIRARIQTVISAQEANIVSSEENITATIIALERAALDRWGKGDPSGFLEISAPDVVYFDPFVERRLDGLDALMRLYESIRGQVHIDRYELINPHVQLCGDAAVLTFNYISYTGEKQSRWNCTEAYQRAQGEWHIIQTHWSFTNRKSRN